MLASGYVKIAIENGPVEIVDLPSYKMVDLSSSLCKRLPEGRRMELLRGRSWWDFDGIWVNSCGIKGDFGEF